MIVAQTPTDQDTDDPSQVASMLDQTDDLIGPLTADGAYDGAPTYQTIAQHGDGFEVVIPRARCPSPAGEPGPLTAARSPFGDDCGTGSQPSRLRLPAASYLSRNDNGPLRALCSKPRLSLWAEASCSAWRAQAHGPRRPSCKKRSGTLPIGGGAITTPAQAPSTRPGGQAPSPQRKFANQHEIRIAAAHAVNTIQ
jgi:hypothetical protein